MILKNHKKINSLWTNTIMLYLLTFSNYFFSFITVPYQTRVFGAEIYGNLGFATSVMTYFQLVFDFGFLLSATEQVTRNKNDKKELSKIVICVFICKIALILVSAVVLAVVCIKIERFREDSLLFVLYFLSTAIYAFIPDFLYRGLENMKAITVRTVLVKLLFTVMIFAFLRDASQYYLVPVLNIFGNTCAVLGVMWHLKNKIGLSIVKVSFKEIRETFVTSSTFFYSRIASTVYSTTNTFILGILYGSSSKTVGYYTSADKLITTGKQAITPITDSLYPYMIRRRDFKLIKKLLLIGMPVLTFGCIIVAVFAEPICGILFGEEFTQAGTILRLLCPVVWCAFPGMMFGFPVLSPMGLAKWANISNIFGAVVQIILLVTLYVGNILNVYTICIATCITEILTLSFRLTVVWKNRRRLETSV